MGPMGKLLKPETSDPTLASEGVEGWESQTNFKHTAAAIPIVSIVVPFLVNQHLYYRILTIKLVNLKKELQWRL